MKWDVVKVIPQENMALSVLFKDGLKGSVRFFESHLTGVFLPLKDPAVFNQVFVNDGAVAWFDGEIDLAPDLCMKKLKKMDRAFATWNFVFKVNYYLQFQQNVILLPRSIT